MSCGKRPLVKLWKKPKNLKVITPSRYEQNEASVKIHWKTVIKNLEDSYKDDQKGQGVKRYNGILTHCNCKRCSEFWETQMDTVRELVGPVIFRRIAKIYNLPLEATKYAPKEETSIVPSEQFYVKKEMGSEVRADFSMSDVHVSEEEEDVEEESAVWSISSVISDESSDSKEKTSKIKGGASSKSINVSKTLSKLLSKSFSRCISRTLSKTTSDHRVKSEQFISPESSAASGDDLDVHFSVGVRYQYIKPKSNPHFEMLYCNESETDMIKWESHYKQKAFEVSASDEFSKRAEILTKKIAKEFYEWWTSLGNVEFKSEIKRPEDIEALFQVWFDEHASRGLMLHPKTLPCVLDSIAEFTNAKQTSCASALKRQLAFDIHAETSPSHTMAFGTSLPQKKKHIPPRNNTKKIWDCVQIPEDLKTMSCVWEDIQHLTSTKSFYEYLQNHPNLPMPPCFKALEDAGDKKQQFVVPSDFIISDGKSGTAVQELALPVSQFTLELKQVLSKLMNE